MNIPLLKQVKEKILAEPDKFDMDDWHCGTAHCIGGWAQVLHPANAGVNFSDPDHEFITTCMKGKAPEDCLELTTFQEDRLFYHYNWPEPFVDDYFRAQTNAERAKIAADRIDHFIATEGRG